jgi:hypothetical protein
VARRGVVAGVVRRAMRRHFHRRLGGGELMARRRGRGGHGGEGGLGVRRMWRNEGVVKRAVLGGQSR